MIQPEKAALAGAALLLVQIAPAQTVSFEPFRVVAANQVPNVEFTVTADVTGDGIPDVLALGTLPNEGTRLYLCAGLGARSFAPAVVIPTPDLQLPGPLFVRPGLVAVDFDGDGDLDVATTTADDRFLALRNDGGGSFSAPAPLSQSATVVIDAGDADGDGTPRGRRSGPSPPRRGRSSSARPGSPRA